MKTARLLLFMCIFVQVQAQFFKNKELKQLDNFGLAVENFDLNQQEIQIDFTNILKFDKKRRKRKTFGIILTTTSVIFSAVGILSLAQENPHAIGEIFGVLALGQGALQGGSTIPLFKSAKKQKRERDKIIKKYNKYFE